MPNQKSGLVPFSYSAFQHWHERASETLFVPAEQTATRVLTELLQPDANDLGPSRLRLQSSRVKSVGRTWTKLLGSDRYYGSVGSPDDVPDVIDDLVGVRVICSNLSDVGRLQDILGELKPDDGGPNPAISFEALSRRDYFESPKDSGYRAFHLNLVVPVLSASGIKRVRVELQARTLLQDGWGELTHEDTYKPGVPVPPWIERMSLRMAELLEVVDNLAQDIRNELDQLSEDSIDSDVFKADVTAEMRPLSQAENVQRSIGKVKATPLTAVLIDETKKAVDALERPASLASVAHTLQMVLGTGVVGTWGGYGSFKALLTAAVPDARLIDQAPGYVLPRVESALAGWDGEGDTGSIFDQGIPPMLVRLKAVDRDLPLVAGPSIRTLIKFTAAALKSSTDDYVIPGDPSKATLADVNYLSKRVRHLADSDGQVVARTHAMYLLKSIFFGHALRLGLTDAEITKAFVAVVATRIRAFHLEDGVEKVEAQLRSWILS